MTDRCRRGLHLLKAYLTAVSTLLLDPSKRSRQTRAMRAAGHRISVLTDRSPSLAPGNTPYVGDVAQRDRLLAWLDECSACFREEIGGRAVTWRDVRCGKDGRPRSCSGA